MTVTKLDVTEQIRSYLKNYKGNSVSPTNKIYELYMTADVLVYKGKEYPRNKSAELLSDLSAELPKLPVNGNSNKSTSEWTKKTIIAAIILFVLLVVFIIRSIGGTSLSDYDSASEKFSPEGTYYADLTLAQSGYMTKIVLHSDGSAEMTEEGAKTKYTYWDYTSDVCEDVRIKGSDYSSWWFIDFSQMKIYFGVEDYRSNQRGYTLKSER